MNEPKDRVAEEPVEAQRNNNESRYGDRLLLRKAARVIAKQDADLAWKLDELANKLPVRDSGSTLGVVAVTLGRHDFLLTTRHHQTRASLMEEVQTIIDLFLEENQHEATIRWVGAFPMAALDEIKIKKERCNHPDKVTVVE